LYVGFATNQFWYFIIIMILNDAQVNRVWESLQKQKEIMLTAPARHMSEQEKMKLPEK
jgi:hypothetical protein